MRFEWDERKNRENYLKHGICFEEAMEIFTDTLLQSFDDRCEYGELREISIGRLRKHLVIVVIHTDRTGTVRIISARKANKRERRRFYEYFKEATERHRQDSG